MPAILEPFPRIHLEQGAAHLHQLGPRAVAEFLAEQAAATGSPPALINRLDRYRTITADMLHVAGGDRFSPRQLDPVPR